MAWKNPYNLMCPNISLKYWSGFLSMQIDFRAVIAMKVDIKRTICFLENIPLFCFLFCWIVIIGSCFQFSRYNTLFDSFLLLQDRRNLSPKNRDFFKFMFHVLKLSVNYAISANNKEGIFEGRYLAVVLVVTTNTGKICNKINVQNGVFKLYFF